MMQARLRQCPSNIACLVRLMPGQAMAPTAAASELVELAHSLVDRVLGFSVDLRLASVGWGRADWDVFWRCLTTERDPIEGKACLSAENMVLVLGTSFSLREVQTACEWGIQHWMIETSRFEGGKLVLAHENTMELPGRIESLVSILKSPASSVLVQGCFTEPEEVSAAIDAGATGALIDLGLVVSGPGFAKRANDWLVSQKVSLESVHDRSSESTPVFRTS